MLQAGCFHAGSLNVPAQGAGGGGDGGATEGGEEEGVALELLLKLVQPRRGPNTHECLGNKPSPQPHSAGWPSPVWSHQRHLSHWAIL